MVYMMPLISCIKNAIRDLLFNYNRRVIANGRACSTGPLLPRQQKAGYHFMLSHTRPLLTSSDKVKFTSTLTVTLVRLGIKQANVLKLLNRRGERSG
jgi:hypothetical protein